MIEYVWFGERPAEVGARSCRRPSGRASGRRVDARVAVVDAGDRAVRGRAGVERHVVVGDRRAVGRERAGPGDAGRRAVGRRAGCRRAAPRPDRRAGRDAGAVRLVPGREQLGALLRALTEKPTAAPFAIDRAPGCCASTGCRPGRTALTATTCVTPPTVTTYCSIALPPASAGFFQLTRRPLVERARAERRWAAAG